MTRAVVLVHGAFHDASCWDLLIPLLEERGLHCTSLDLYRGGRDEDAAAVQAEIDRLRAAGYSVGVVGHSLGCAPLAQLDPQSLTACVFLAGPAVGPGLPDVADCPLPAFFRSTTSEEDGTMHFDPAAARDLFYNTCTPEAAASAAKRLRPMRTYGPAEISPPIWQQVPSTYLVCERDQCVDPAYQRKIAPHMPWYESLDSDHSPMLCQPEHLADVLVRALARTT